MVVDFNFGDTIQVLKDVGVFEYVLPFLLIFSIIFAILEKTKILGSDKTNINIVVSSVIALLVLVQQGIVATINLFLPRVSLVIVVILMGLLIIAMISGKEFTGLKGGVFSIAVILIIIAVLLSVFLPEDSSGIYISPQDRNLLINIGIPLAVFLIAIALVVQKPKKEGEEGVFSKLIKGIERGAK